MVRALLVIAVGCLLVGCTRGASEAKVESEAARLARDGRDRLADGDKKAARAHFQRALDLAPKEPHGRLGLAVLELLEGNTPAALDQVVALRAAGIDPASDAPWLVAFLDAREHFPAALTVNAGSAGDVVEPPKAAPDAVESVTAEPLATDAPLVEAFRRGDYEAVRRAIEPETSPSLFRQKLLADAYYNLQDWTRAVRAYRLVLRQDPGNEPVTQYLADALVRLKRYDEAIGFYRVLAENNSARPGFWRLIGDVAMAKGDEEVALASYLKAVAAGYDDPSVKAAIETLQTSRAAPPAPAPPPIP